MNRANPTPSPRRALANVALIAALVGLAALLAQCRMVSNDVLGVGLQRGADQANACTSECTKTASQQKMAENAQHRDNVKACDKDETCLRQEELRHEAALQSIEDAHQACLNNCHSQGRGTAGN